MCFWSFISVSRLSSHLYLSVCLQFIHSAMLMFLFTVFEFAVFYCLKLWCHFIRQVTVMSFVSEAQNTVAVFFPSIMLLGFMIHACISADWAFLFSCVS